MKKQLNIIIEEDLIKEIQHLAINKNMTVSNLITKLIEKEVRK